MADPVSGLLDTSFLKSIVIAGGQSKLDLLLRSSNGSFVLTERIYEEVKAGAGKFPENDIIKDWIDRNSSPGGRITIVPNGSEADALVAQGVTKDVGEKSLLDWAKSNYTQTGQTTRLYIDDKYPEVERLKGGGAPLPGIDGPAKSSVDFLNDELSAGRLSSQDYTSTVRDSRILTNSRIAADILPPSEVVRLGENYQPQFVIEIAGINSSGRLFSSGSSEGTPVEIPTTIGEQGLFQRAFGMATDFGRYAVGQVGAAIGLTIVERVVNDFFDDMALSAAGPHHIELGATGSLGLIAIRPTGDNSSSPSGYINVKESDIASSKFDDGSHDLPYMATIALKDGFTVVNVKYTGEIRVEMNGRPGVPLTPGQNIYGNAFEYPAGTTISVIDGQRVVAAVPGKGTTTYDILEVGSTPNSTQKSWNITRVKDVPDGMNSEGAQPTSPSVETMSDGSIEVTKISTDGSGDIRTQKTTIASDDSVLVEDELQGQFNGSLQAKAQSTLNVDSAADEIVGSVHSNEAGNRTTTINGSTGRSVEEVDSDRDGHIDAREITTQLGDGRVVDEREAIVGGVVQSRERVTTGNDSQAAVVQTDANADGQFERTDTIWANASQVVETVDTLGVKTREVTTTIAGQDVAAKYTVDAQGKEHIVEVRSIDGAAPTDADAAWRALDQSGIGSMDLARMSDGSFALSGDDAAQLAAARGEAASILSAFNNGDADGIATAPGFLEGSVPYLSGLNDVLTIANLGKAIAQGNPLAIVAGAASASKLLARGYNSAIFDGSNAYGTALAGVVGAINLGFGVKSMVEALNRGDVLSAIASGASVAQATVGISQTVVQTQIASANQVFQQSRSLDDLIAVTELEDVSKTLGQVGTVLAAVGSAIGAIQAFQQGDILNGILSSVSAVLSLAYVFLAIPGLQWVTVAIAAVQFVVSLLDGSLFGSGYNPPHPNGEARLDVLSDTTVGARTTWGWDGGGNLATDILNPYSAAVNALVDSLRNNGFSDATLIPERLLVHLEKLVSPYSLTLSINDEYGNLHRINYGSNNPLVRQTDGYAIDDPLYFSQSLGDTIVRAAMQAIGPKWEAETAHLQFQNNVGYGGKSALVHMAQTGQLEANPSSPTKTVKLITLDLPGTGSIPVAARAAGHGTMFKIDGDGYAHAMDWVGPRAGILGLDRDNNGVLDTGRDLLNDMRFTASARGLGALKEFDADGDHAITKLDHALGTFTRNGGATAAAECVP